MPGKELAHNAAVPGKVLLKVQLLTAAHVDIKIINAGTELAY